MKLVVSIILFTFILYAQKITIAIKNINFKQKVTSADVIKIEYDKQLNCEPIDIDVLNQHNYIAKHYIIKGKPIYKKDIKIAKKHIVKFDFGNIIIEKEGEIITKTKHYIKIKKSDGKIEKIYINGNF